MPAGSASSCTSPPSTNLPPVGPGLLSVTGPSACTYTRTCLHKVSEVAGCYQQGLPSNTYFVDCACKQQSLSLCAALDSQTKTAGIQRHTIVANIKAGWDAPSPDGAACVGASTSPPGAFALSLFVPGQLPCCSASSKPLVASLGSFLSASACTQTTRCQLISQASLHTCGLTCMLVWPVSYHGCGVSYTQHGMGWLPSWQLKQRGT